MQKSHIVVIALFLSAIFFIFYFQNVDTKENNRVLTKKKNLFQNKNVSDYDDWDYKLKYTSNFVPITEKERNLFSKLKSIKKSCGEVCDTSKPGVPGKYYEHITKKVDCQGLFTNPDIDALSEYDEPPKKIPNYLLPEFTHGGKWEVIDDWRNDANGVTHSLVWTRDDIQDMINKYEKGQLEGNYGKGAVDSITWHLDNIVSVKNQTVLIIGSQNPWLEAMLLSKGAKNITTFDYLKIESHHSQIETITPVELAQKYFAGVTYDVMISFSSVEHSGLGRYGDMLNPWGDLIAMARSWCLVKPGGFGIVGVPTGPDRIGFNSHKIYGPLGYAQLFANWEQLYTETDFSKYSATGCWFCYQPVHSLKRI